MPSKNIRFIVEPIKTKNNFIKREADNTIKELKKFVKGEGANVLKKDMNATIQRWNRAPSIVSEYSESPNRIQAYIHAKGRYTTNWQRVSDGTGPRTIRSSKGQMVFRRDYHPHTTPQGAWTGPGSKTGEIVRTNVVRRHRIKPREFSKKIVAKRKGQLIARMEAIKNKAWGI